MSRKYIIELENRPYMKAGKAIYKAKNFKTLVFDESGLEQLEPYDRDAIENEVWQFVTTLFSELPADDFCGGAWCEDVVRCNSYHQAREKFECWFKEKQKKMSKKTDTIDAILDAIEAANITAAELNERAKARREEQEKEIPFE